MISRDLVGLSGNLPEFLNNSEQNPQPMTNNETVPSHRFQWWLFQPDKNRNRSRPTPPTTATPSTGCESDEQAVRVQGLSGDFCSPKCDSTGSCPSDVPTGDTATPVCFLETATGDKYCALICTTVYDCGSQVAFQMFVLKSMNERDREACTQTFSLACWQ